MKLFKPNVRELLARRDVQGLIKALESGDLKVSALAAVALGELGPEAKEAILHLKTALLANEKAQSKANLKPSNLKEFEASYFVSEQGRCIRTALDKIER